LLESKSGFPLQNDGFYHLLWKASGNSENLDDEQVIGFNFRATMSAASAMR